MFFLLPANVPPSPPPPLKIFQSVYPPVHSLAGVSEHLCAPCVAARRDESQVRVRGSSVLTWRPGDQPRVCGPAAVYLGQCPLPPHLPQMYSLVYLALVEALEILPWHVRAGCCPGGETRRITRVEERTSERASERAHREPLTG